MKLAYAAYVTVSAFAIVIFVRSVPLFIDPLPHPKVDPTSAAALVYEPLRAVTGAFGILESAVFIGMGLFVLRARPGDRFALLVSLMGVLQGMFFVSSVQLVYVDPAWTIPVYGLANVTYILAMAVLLTLPDGRLVPRLAAAVLVVFAVWRTLGWALPFVGPCYCRSVLPTVVTLGLTAIAVGCQIYRYRVVADRHQRDQMKWITFALVVYFFGEVANYLSARAWPQEFAAIHRWVAAPGEIGPGAEGLLIVSGVTIAYRVVLIGVALAFAIAVLRAHLLDIDLVMNRALLYGGTTIVLVALFAGASSLAQLALEAGGVQGSGLVTAVIAAAAAAAFGPLRARLAPLVDRVLPERASLSLIFLDIVGSTERAAAIGDERWREVLTAYRAEVRRETARANGREIDNAGDGFFLVFGDPVRALGAAVRIRSELRALSLEIRIGVHVGECQMRGEKPTGLAVHAAARVMSFASAGEIYLSADARESLAVSGVHMVDRGTHLLKGLPGEWRLYMAEPA